MQAEQKPSGWVVVGSQTGAYILAALLMVVLYFILSTVLQAVFLRTSSAGTPPGVAWSMIIFLSLIAGLALAALQRSILRRWLPKRTNWLAVSGVAMVVLILGEIGLLSRLALHPPVPTWYVVDYSMWQVVLNLIARWSLLGGLLAGLPGGLLFGMVQARFLPWHQRLWWLLSALAWALIAALALTGYNSLTAFAGPSE